MTAPAQTNERRRDTLTALTGEAIDLLEAIDSAEGDEQMEAALAAALDENGELLDDKMEAYARIITDLDIEGEARKAEAKRMADLARASHVKRDRVKAWLKRHLDMLGIKKKQAGPYTLTVANNGGALPIEWETEDVTRIPDEYLVQVPQIDKKAVRAALDAGKDIGFARLGQRGSNLRIK